MHTSRRRVGRLLVAVLLVAGLVSGINGLTSPARAETGKKALILQDTAGGREEVRAAALGFTVTTADAATWAAMTAAQFADYQLIIIGDPDGGIPSSALANTQNLTDAVMGRAGGNSAAGNRILIGTDPNGHSQGVPLMDAAVDFAGTVDGATGLYLAVSDSDRDWDGDGTPDVLQKILPKITSDPTPNWTENSSPPCGGSVSLISQVFQFSTVDSSDLQGWGCSDHETWPTYPSDFLPLAVATDTPTAPTCGNDVDTGAPACGEAYLLIAGTGVSATSPNLSLTPVSEANIPVPSSSSVTANVHAAAGTPLAGVPVSFSITGVNAGAVGSCSPSDCNSDANGNVVFSYTGTVSGVDTIIASAVVSGSNQSATATKGWAVGTPTPTNVAPVFDFPPTPNLTVNAYVDTSYPFEVKAHDADAGDTVSISLTPGNVTPASITGTSNSTTLSSVFKANAVGVYPVVASATDGKATTTHTITFNVVRRPTTLVAYPAVVAIPRFPKALNLTASGRLTSLGQPVAGRQVHFTTGQTLPAHVCFAITDANGFASCTSIASAIQATLTLGYRSDFVGDFKYLPSTDGGNVTAVLGLPLP